MAETPYLVDSNVLLRWVKPDHSEYPTIISAIDAVLKHDGVLCYTSQNVAEFWNACTRPVVRNGYGLAPQEADRRARFFEEKLRLLPDSLAVHEEWRKILVTYNGALLDVGDFAVGENYFHVWVEIHLFGAQIHYFLWLAQDCYYLIRRLA